MRQRTLHTVLLTIIDIIGVISIMLLGALAMHLLTTGHSIIEEKPHISPLYETASIAQSDKGNTND